MFRKVYAAFLAAFLTTGALFAGQLIPIEVEPLTHAEATLVVVDSSGTERSYSPADLEALPTYSLETTTPWRAESAEFTGVLLRDILAVNGIDYVKGIIVTAENDYATVLDRELLENVDILVATRVNGRAHTRRARGPIQFVIDADIFETSELTSNSNLVWMAARIEAQD